MKDKDQQQAQPWHPADDKPARRTGPIGTPSFTGGGAEVGMPVPPAADAGAERSRPRDEPAIAREVDPLAEPRAGTADQHGRKP